VQSLFKSITISTWIWSFLQSVLFLISSSKCSLWRVFGFLQNRLRILELFEIFFLDLLALEKLPLYMFRVLSQSIVFWWRLSVVSFLRYMFFVLIFYREYRCPTGPPNTTQHDTHMIRHNTIWHDMIWHKRVVVSCRASMSCWPLGPCTTRTSLSRVVPARLARLARLEDRTKPNLYYKERRQLKTYLTQIGPVLLLTADPPVICFWKWIRWKDYEVP
jgi:hypothetical protein